MIERYTYDNLNQLKTVTRGSDVYEYFYDKGGNILEVRQNGETIKAYGYEDSEWKDALTSYNGQSITYDAIGNPIQYRNNITFSWKHGRNLASAATEVYNLTYTYNADGKRAEKQKTNRETGQIETHYYEYNGDILINERWGEEELWYLHDESGSYIGFTYNGTTYYYVKNLQGDVTGIADEEGTLIVAYTYNEWGKVVSITGSHAETIGQLNPFRYRGYYYDAETGLYLTGTRYYDPEIGRFINADNQISGVGSDIRGYNLFAYCFNNPVNMSDPTGNWPRWITATVAAVAAVVAVVATVVSAPVVATVAATVAVVSTVAYVAQSHHYDKRKSKNTNLPKTPQEADDLNWKNSNPKSDINPNGGGPAADCHQYTSPDKSNVKFVSPDGHREVIYNSTGNMVLDSRDIGTYNYSPSGTFFGSIGHFFADMLPWYLFGNDDDDPGPLVNEIIRLFE